jgi:hypothetical protein
MGAKDNFYQTVPKNRLFSFMHSKCSVSMEEATWPQAFPKREYILYSSSLVTLPHTHCPKQNKTTYNHPEDFGDFSGVKERKH